jgi:hypothetical protein
MAACEDSARGAAPASISKSRGAFKLSGTPGVLVLDPRLGVDSRGVPTERIISNNPALIVADLVVRLHGLRAVNWPLIRKLATIADEEIIVG